MGDKKPHDENKTAFRTEEFRLVNRACPECGARWLAPGCAKWIDIERCADCASIRRGIYGEKVRSKYIQVGDFV